MMAVSPIPDRYHSITPYLSVKGASDAIEFYAKAFGAEELFRLPMPGGLVGHAEIKIGDSTIMLADPCESEDFLSPDQIGGSPVCLYLYVEDVDAVFAQAVAAGAKELRAVEDQFYGDRMGKLEDPFGHVWSIGTHKEDLTPEEVGERAAAMFAEEKD